MSVILFILILSFLVLIHELGHFIMARRAGITVEEFGIGYPPLAVKLFTWKGTVFSLNWIPFGGFVRMAGEETEAEDTADDKKQPSKGQFYQASNGNKMAVILAGATVNFIFGVIAFSIVFSFMGIPTELTTARIGAVAPGSPAEAAGLPKDVEIIAVTLPNETAEVVSIQSSEQLIGVIKELKGQTVTLTTTGPCQNTACAESAQQFSVYLRTPEETPEDQGSLGITFASVIFQQYPWWQMPFRGIWYGLDQAFYLGQQIFVALGTIVTDVVSLGGVPDELAGPVGIVHQAQSSGLFSEGPLALLSFAGMLSVNLAIMNILPIPPLDGGRAVMILIAPFLSKTKRLKLEYYANYTGYVLLLALILFITIRDISRVITG